MASNAFLTFTFQQMIDDGVLEIGDGYRAKNSELGGDGLIFLRAGHVTDYYINFEGDERFYAHLKDKVESKFSKLGDTIVTTKGNSTGRTSFVTDKMPRFVYSPHLSYWRIKDRNKIDNGFLRYWSRGHEFLSQLAGMKASTDMAPYLSLSDQRRLRITLFPIRQQRRIAHILGSLDDKIELNRRMNARLEGMAQALFKSWFVDFDPVIDNVLAAGNPIPDALRAKAESRMLNAEKNNSEFMTHHSSFPSAFQLTEEMGWIPEGWEVRSFEDAPLQILDGDRGKNYPKRTEFTQSGHCLFLNAGNVTQKGFNFSSTDFISIERDELLRKGKLQREDIVLTTRGTVGNLAYYDKDIPFDNIRINSGMVILRSRPKDHYSLFLLHFLNSEYFKEQVEALTSGSAQPQLPIRDIKKILLISPNNEHMLSAFSNLIASTLDKATKQAEQSRGLTKLRDTLLPRLISGELRIVDAEKLAEAI